MGYWVDKMKAKAAEKGPNFVVRLDLLATALSVADGIEVLHIHDHVSYASVVEFLTEADVDYGGNSNGTLTRGVSRR